MYTALLTDASIGVRTITANIRYEQAGSARSSITLHLKQDQPEVMAQALKFEREGLVIGEHKIPVAFLAERQAPGTVRLMILDLPPEYAVQGITEAILSCAGYEHSSSMVVAEFAGATKVNGVVLPGIGKSDRIVDYVQPPADDPLLCKLPEAYTFPKGPRTVFAVDGRSPSARYTPVPIAVAAARAAVHPQPPPPPRPRPPFPGPSLHSMGPPLPPGLGLPGPLGMASASPTACVGGGGCKAGEPPAPAPHAG